MPIYVYRAAIEDSGCATCRDGFEVLQRLSDAPPAACPECGAAVARVQSAAQVVSGGAHRLREGHLAKHGFTQYRKVGKGRYEKTVGTGPATLSADKD